MLTKLWDLQFEIDGDEIQLEQDMGCGDVARITLHRVHLQLLAERLGLVREVSASEADIVRTVTTLKRRMRLLRDRVHHLHEMLAITAGAGREDLDYELTHCGATLDLLDEFCEEIEPSVEIAPSHAPVTRDAPVTSPPESSGGQRELLLAADAAQPMANRCATDGQPMANAIRGAQP